MNLARLKADLPSAAPVAADAPSPAARRAAPFSYATNEDLGQPTYVSCQPVVDVGQATVGYELICDGLSTVASVGVSRTSLLTTFVRVTAEHLFDPAIDALAAAGMVLIIDLDGPADEALVERCRRLRERGFSLALSCYAGIDDRSRPLLCLLDVVAIDLRSTCRERCRELAGSLAHLPIKLLAQGVDTDRQMDFCLDAGFHYFQGNRIALPEVIGKHPLTVSRSRLLRLIERVEAQADTAAIEEELKKEAALIFNLLSMLPHDLCPAEAEGGNLRRALAWFEDRSLLRWLQFQLITPEAHPADSNDARFLLRIAALRGRTLETLLGRFAAPAPASSDAAYLTGCLSMLPAALGTSRSDVLEQVAVDHAVAAALTAHAGFLGQLLEALECFDRNELSACEQRLRQLSCGQLGAADLEACFKDTLHWLTDSRG